MRWARASASALRSPSGMTRLIRPHSSAVRAGTRSPSIAISAALAKPIRSGMRKLEPPSGTRPMFTNASIRYDDWAASTRSQESAKESPMPTAGPLIAAIAGFGMVRSPSMIGWKRSSRARLIAGRPSSSGSKPALRSAPLQNARPLPVSTTARVSSSPAACWTASRNSSPRSLSTAFIASGRLSVSVVTPPRRSISTFMRPILRVTALCKPGSAGRMDDVQRNGRRPRIGLCAALERARWTVWDREAFLLSRAYVDALQAGGAIAFMLPPDEWVAAHPDDVLDGVDGLMLAGGADIDPGSYGAARHPKTINTRPDRDAAEIALCRRARERDIPVLGICRGMQLMNVALGGTLIQPLPDDLGHGDHRRSLGSFDNADHDVRLE